jgi:hypothetical protein
MRASGFFAAPAIPRETGIIRGSAPAQVGIGHGPVAGHGAGSIEWPEGQGGLCLHFRQLLENREIGAILPAETFHEPTIASDRLVLA